ncbi:MAG TPA: sigma-70 family RNA polymerase sigma factor, partial [Blastocatellia bacterium]|nr:sigma-70 family RNA polymerase sigma factor [Blastocatellia bacterium]
MMEKQAPEAGDDVAQREDRDLIAACLAGDSAAWEALVARYQRLVYSIPLKARLSADDAADIFQSVWLKLYEKLAGLRDHEKLSSWLITTTTREVWRVSSRNRRDSPPAGPDDDEQGNPLEQIAATAPLADAESETLEQQQLVRAALDALPDRCRNLLTMLFYEKDELSYAEIAQRMEMPVPSVGPTRARCLDKMKKLL